MRGGSLLMHTPSGLPDAAPSSLGVAGLGAAAAAAQTDAGRAGAGSMIDAPGSPRDGSARSGAWMQGQGPKGRQRKARKAAKLQDCAAQQVSGSAGPEGPGIGWTGLGREKRRRRRRTSGTGAAVLQGSQAWREPWPLRACWSRWIRWSRQHAPSSLPQHGARRTS